MAFTVTQRVISSEDTIYSYCDNLCRKAKLLYNAALFRVRNVFTGYEKEHRTENEIGVFFFGFPKIKDKCKNTLKIIERVKKELEKINDMKEIQKED